MRLDSIFASIARVLAMVLCGCLPALAQQGTGAPGKGAEAGRALVRSASAAAASSGGQSSRLLTRCPETRTAARDSRDGQPAQVGPVAWLHGLEGNVLVSVDSGLIAGREGLTMSEYTRVVTTGTGKLVVSYCDGCDVPLEPNQRLEIRLTQPCARRALDVRAVLIDSAVIGSVSAPFASAALGGSLQAGAGVLGGLGGSIAIVRGREDDVVSPN